jgi:hypothetical protein
MQFEYDATPGKRVSLGSDQTVAKDFPSEERSKLFSPGTGLHLVRFQSVSPPNLRAIGRICRSEQRTLNKEPNLFLIKV